MTREELEKALKELGWKKDRWGHYQKIIVGKSNPATPDSPPTFRKYRVKMQINTCRIERQLTLTSKDQLTVPSIWSRVGGSFYKDIVQLTDGRLRIGSIYFGGTKTS
jgi:hypothetical protein